jgi:CubicO group peptidase (beta-lactamase class C family)
MATLGLRPAAAAASAMPTARRPVPVLRCAGLILGCCLLVATATAAEPLSADVAAKINRLFARVDRKDTPGAVVAIAKDGVTIFERGYGMANLEHGIPLAPESLSETGSVAKQFTASAVVTLAVRGQLSLDDSILQHLPQLPAICRDITLRMMLDHTSGLRDIHGLFDLMGRPTYTDPHENAEVLEVMSRQRQLNFPPGTEYVYSNTGYLLLTFVVERVSGVPFADFCRDAIFTPRGMTHTAWRTQFTRIVPGHASAYSMEADGTFRVNLPYRNIHGNGGLLTTVDDLLLWNDSFEHPTGEWAEVVRLMQIPSKLKNGRAIENGLGLRIGQYRGLDEVSHSGATAGYSTFLARFPSEHLSIAFLGNLSGLDGSAFVYRITDLLLDPVLAPRPARPVAVPLAPEALAAFAGLYHSPEHDLLVPITVKAGKLMLNAVELVPIGPHTFSVNTTGGKVEFSTAPDGGPRRVSFTSNRITRTYTAVPAVKPTPTQLAAYAGDYYSPELDVTIPVAVVSGNLSVRIRPSPAQTAEPTFADGFWLGPTHAWHLTFTRDSAGAIDGFEATNAIGRCRRVKFVHR